VLGEFLLRRSSRTDFPVGAHDAFRSVGPFARVLVVHAVVVTSTRREFDITNSLTLIKGVKFTTH